MIISFGIALLIIVMLKGNLMTLPDKKIIKLWSWAFLKLWLGWPHPKKFHDNWGIPWNDISISLNRFNFPQWIHCNTGIFISKNGIPVYREIPDDRGIRTFFYPVTVNLG